MSNRKIDIYKKDGSHIINQWHYVCSTNKSSTCKEAKQKYCDKHNLNPHLIRANFSRKV